MNGVIMMVIAIVVLGGGYLFYGRYLEKKWGIDPNAKTPAYELEDGCICSGYTQRFFNMIKMSIVKWIIFCNKTNDFHNILLKKQSTAHTTCEQYHLSPIQIM